MAKFSFNGMDELSASFEQLAQLSDEERMSVIMPGAKLLLERQREKIRSLFHQWTGALADSLHISEKSDDDGAYAYIQLKGKHPINRTGERNKDGKAPEPIPSTTAAIGYILEYGSPRIAATHWMEQANEDAVDDVVAAQQEAWNELLTKKGL